MQVWVTRGIAPKVRCEGRADLWADGVPRCLVHRGGDEISFGTACGEQCKHAVEIPVEDGKGAKRIEVAVDGDNAGAGRSTKEILAAAACRSVECGLVFRGAQEDAAVQQASEVERREAEGVKRCAEPGRQAANRGR